MTRLMSVEKFNYSSLVCCCSLSLLLLVIIPCHSCQADSADCGFNKVTKETCNCSITSSCAAKTCKGNCSVPKTCCEREKQWPRTKRGQNATVTNGCYMGAVPGTRRCNCNCTWDKVFCCEKTEFIEVWKKLNGSLREGLKGLSDMKTYRNISLKQRAFLLHSIVRDSKTNPKISNNIVKEFLNTTRSLIAFTQADTELDFDNRTSIGTQLLTTLDEFALRSIEPNTETRNLEFGENSIVAVLEYDQEQTDRIIGIISDDRTTCITLPSEVLGTNTTQEVHIASFIHQNISDLLPPRVSENMIVSPIVSSITDCQNCDNSILMNNVTLMLQVKGAFEMTKTGNLSCIFFDIEDFGEDEFPTGQWRKRGCTITSIARDSVNCSCNHLTHFAILLSPSEEITEPNRKALNILGVVLVPISLFCMIIIILTYSLIRSLWSMRNYIHIMLCVSMFSAQVVFMIGIDKVENKSVCSSIAVLLQYLFLVVFMWMLMEGVVLYVTLVRVFIKNHIYYIIGFTIISYVVPAVYMGAIVPIGFLVGVNDTPSHTHYLYYNKEGQLQACWLNYNTHFIWSFIAPVSLILLTNIGFFIMTIVIITRHSRRNKDRKDALKVKHWLKASISLCVVMGFTWLAGLLAFRKELLFVAYIMSAFIAGQGIILFIILIPLNIQVREAYSRLWQKKKTNSEMLTKLSSIISSSANSQTNDKRPGVFETSSNTKETHNERHAVSTGGTSFDNICSTSNLMITNYDQQNHTTDYSMCLTNGEVSCNHDDTVVDKKDNTG